MIVSEEKIEVPDECGEFCPRWRAQQAGEAVPFTQGDACCRCPIFNCRETDGTEDGYGVFRLLEPEQFSADMARAYVDWWKADRKKQESFRG